MFTNAAQSRRVSGFHVFANVGDTPDCFGKGWEGCGWSKHNTSSQALENELRCVDGRSTVASVFVNM